MIVSHNPNSSQKFQSFALAVYEMPLNAMRIVFNGKKVDRLPKSKHCLSRRDIMFATDQLTNQLVKTITQIYTANARSLLC